MKTSARQNLSFIPPILRQAAPMGALLLGACLLGAAVITMGANSSAQTITFGALAFGLIGWSACLILELPLISVVRWAFIGSFFFKGELNVYKINEIEDPSGFNLSLTLLSGLCLLLYDQLAESEPIRVRVFPNFFSILLAALFICAGISILYSGSQLLGWFSLWSFLTSVLTAYVIASHFSRRERLIHLITGVAIGLLLTGIVALSQYAINFPTNLAVFGTGTEEEMLGTQSVVLSRVPAFLRTPTEMAWVVSTLLPLVIAPIVCRVKNLEPTRKLILVTAALSGAIAVILSLARGSWISLLVAVLLVVLCGWYRQSAKERKSYFFSVGAAAVLACLLLSPFAERIYERLTADDDGSALIRLPLMENAVAMIKDNPLVGVGLNEYRSQMTKYDETGIFVSQVFPNPVHNVFAHISAEIGIPGGIIFCLLVVVAFFESIKALPARDRLLFALALGATAGLIAFVISAMKEPGSLGSVRPPLRTCFFLFGTIMAISRIRQRLLF